MLRSRKASKSQELISDVMWCSL
uniref:Uncharacterized protein n=1 Tax=Anguilla anguilla TaxID=7936 RepID=A0A0E9RCL2_ANGAN